jgi:urea transport system substrate-binding protein
MAVAKAGTTNVDAVRVALAGLTYQAPEGLVTVDGDNHHLLKEARIGVIDPSGQITEIWNSGQPIVPDPFLHSYPWAAGLA